MIMKLSLIRIISIRSFCVFSVLLLFPPEGNFFVRNVGQDAIFMLNRTSGSIFEAQWGFFDSGFIRPSFIYINKFTNRPIHSSDLDTPSASRYKGRVYWVGDLNASRAWFKITNININDTNEYAVRLQDGNAVDTIYRINLIVAAPPQFNPHPPHEKNIGEGQELRVPCTAVGPPTPNITWIQVISHVTKSTGTGSATLMIPNIRREQNGTYECQARNNPNERPVTAQTVVSVYYPPNITTTFTTKTVVQSDEIVLTCTADSYPPPSISWTKVDGVIKDGHTVAGGTLRIPDAIKTDAGKYKCTAKNTYDNREHTNSATATVIVKYQPSIINQFLNKTANESDSLRIKCDANGYPPPTIKWKTPTGSVHNGNVYNIPSVSRSHAGTYTCTASNVIGREAMASIQVNVQYKPVIDDYQSSSKSNSWNGNSIRLRCFANGLPTPRISWYKPTNQQITTGVNIVPEGSEVTVLTTADQGDYGQYKCRATNILGSDEHVINVTRLFTPVPVTITITEIEASSAIVRWTKPADGGGSPVTAYLLETDSHIFVRTIDAYTVLTGLKKDTQYRVTVYAKNLIGYGVSSTKIFTTDKTGKPDIPELLTALLIQTASKMKVLLRWKKSDDNGATILRYTIYMKEESKQSDWKKIEDVRDYLLLEYIVGTTIKYGKTYKFTVTAWNKYGESIMDERNVETVNTTTDKTAYGSGKSFISCTKEGSKYITTVLGVIIAILFLSLGLNLLQFIWSRKNARLHCGKQKQLNQRTKKSPNEEIYDNDLEMDDKVVTISAVTTSFPQPPCNTVPEYETIQQLNEIASSQDEIPLSHPRHYEGLNLPDTSERGVHGPVYEPLRTRSVDPNVRLDNNNEQHPYEPLNIRNQNSTYQSLQVNGRESNT